MTVVLDTRADFTLEHFRRVAWDGEGVEIGPLALERMASTRASFSARACMSSRACATESRSMRSTSASARP